MSGWSCRGYRTLLVDHAESVLPPRQRQRVEQHLAGCPACTEALAALRDLPGALRRSAVPDPDPEFFRQQRQAVARAIRNAPAPAVRWRPAGWSDSWRLDLWRYPAAVAAALLVALFVYRYTSRLEPPSGVVGTELAALDTDALAALHEMMQALVPAEEQNPVVGPDDEAILTALPVGDLAAAGDIADAPQANDLSDTELDGLNTLLGDLG